MLLLDRLRLLAAAATAAAATAAADGRTTLFEGKLIDDGESSEMRGRLARLGCDSRPRSREDA